MSDQTQQIPEGSTRKHAERLLQQGDFLMAAELVRQATGNEAWNRSIQDEFGQNGDISDLHRSLMALRQRIILTTNFDKFLEIAWRECNTEARHHVQVSIGVTSDSFRALRDDKEHIFLLHGSVDKPDSMIFAKSDYNSKAYGSWEYRRFIETLLMTHTLLFVGFSMNDPAITFLIEMYAHHLPASRPHYIFTADEISPEFITAAKTLRRLFVVPYNNTNDHAELVEILNRYGQRAIERRREIISDDWREIESRYEAPLHSNLPRAETD
ncbi:MAG TPA: SIR2 family protein [Thermoanaerobaculia bacterium]|nr:SIR2 family protein [Thermoanaerobaculia bacterium]